MKVRAGAIVLTLLAAGCSSSATDGAADATAPDSTAADAFPSTSSTTEAPVEDPRDETLPPTITEAASPPTSRGNLYDEDLRADVPNQIADYPIGYYGDSLAHSAQEHVEQFLDAGLRFRFVERSFPGTALCDWIDEIEVDRAREDYWGVVLLFSNNTFTSCMADATGEPLSGQAAFDKFAADLRAVVADFRADGTRVYLPTLPITRSSMELGVDEIAQYNELFASLATGDEGVIVVDAARAVLGPDGEYVEALPCLPLEPCVGGVDDDGVGINIVREPDGAHFCSGGYGDGVEIVPGNCPGWSSGAWRYAGALTAPIIEDGYAEWSADPASQDPTPTP
ncbi:MAG: hypothetical protein OES57_15525 [Acidimicrobiia bacterium]|nr:hypothetical protein [Acidimicrobiia bacterium]